MTATSTRQAEHTASGSLPACRVRQLSVAYRAEPVLNQVGLEVPQGVVMGVVGPNGAGKSTLIKAMLGLVKPITGDCRFFGEPLDRVRNRVGYLPQSASVDWDFPTTVLDVVTMGTYGRLGWLRRPGRAERARARSALAQTGMAAFADRQIGELSGGQKQRVLLARTLVQEPDLYFMDEPLQGVDAVTQRTFAEILASLRSRGRTVVIVHHDLATVRTYCDQVTLLNRTVVASGPADVVFTKKNVGRTYEVEQLDDALGDHLS